MSGGSGSGFRGKFEHVLYSGDKKHVMAGIAIIGVVFCSPWFHINRVMLKIGSIWLMFTRYCRIKAPVPTRITWKRPIRHDKAFC